MSFSHWPLTCTSCGEITIENSSEINKEQDWKIIKQQKINMDEVGDKSINNLKFADDAEITTDSQKKLQNLIEQNIV